MKKRFFSLSAPAFISLLLMLWAPIPARADGPVNPFKDLKGYVNQAMEDWGVPGLALALVKDDQVVFARGYGVREVGKGQPVDENTIFAIGSASKAFTSTAIGLLVQDGKIAWDDHVTDHLSGFQMYDPWVTREITVRDLLCNRSGLGPDSESLWYGTDHSRNEIVRRLRYAKPWDSFRYRFGYRNTMFLTAGQIIPAVTGATWDDFVKKRIFKPLEMTRSSTSVKDLRYFDNVAVPHLNIDNQIAPIPFRNVDQIGPAGSINATISDMSQWLRFQLSGGRHNGRRIAEAAVIKETHKPHTPIPMIPEYRMKFPWGRRLDYCLSWIMVDHMGDLVLFHTGTIDGIHAAIGFIPDRQIGAVVLANYENQALSDALFLRALDILSNREPRDWSTVFLENQKKQKTMKSRSARALEASRVRGTSPRLPLPDYTGVYDNDLYGGIRVTLERDHLVLHLSSQSVSDLRPWHYDTFQAVRRDTVAEARLGKSFVRFELDNEGRVSKLTMDGILGFQRR